MASEFWYIELPTGKTLRGEGHIEAANRELTELVERGWEPISARTATLIGRHGFLLKKKIK
jgi:hypothetical protein